MSNIKENKKYHFTYKTTNLINGRYYLGMHSTNKIDDGYLGSGKRLYYELNKYGKENFKIEILNYFNLREDLVQGEINLITDEDLKNLNCLNLSKGGCGGIHNEEHYRKFVKGPKNLTSWNEKQKELRKDPEWVKWLAIKTTMGQKKIGFNYKTFIGKTHTPETIKKMKESRKGQSNGENNSQYGTCWITNNIENKKIFKGDLIPEGWRLGRVLTKQENTKH